MLIGIAFNTIAQSPSNLKELKKEASARFEDEEYAKAYPLYAQLVANYPKDPEFNFRLGVCMIYSEPDKKKSLNYLKAVDPNAKDAPKELLFFLGKAYHINYLFDEALKNYNSFKTKAPASLQKKLQVDREITACINGKKLLSNLTDISVRSKKQLNEADYFRTYDVNSLGGKLLVKPEEFRTAADKKKKESSVIFLPKNSDVIYFSSYGETTNNGKDLFTARKQADGSFGKPEPLVGINTPFDEDYPFLHPNGKSLYFASKGFNSMGGYDIFRSDYDSLTNTWSTPQNLEFPINSPDDDYLFVTDSLEQTAYFSTGRQSPPGKIDVLKISIARRPLDVLAVKGKVEPEKPDQALNSKIMIKYLNSVRTVGEFEADAGGDYELQMPNGESLVFTVETPGLITQSATVTVPKSDIAKPCRQVIAYEKGKLKISNFFDEAAGEDNYLNYLKVIEEKAKLDVNAEDKAPSQPVAVKEQAEFKAQNRKDNSGPQIIEEAAPAAANSGNLNNKDLAVAVKKEAERAAENNVKLNQDARDAYKLSGEYNDSYSKKYAEAQTLIRNSETMEDEADKTQAIEQANKLKTEAEQDKLLASKLLVYGKSLEDDARNSKTISELNSQFSAALSKSKSNSLGNDPKLAGLQGQILNSGNSSASKEYANSLQKDTQEKEQQLTGIESSIIENQNTQNELRTEISQLEEKLDKTKKKSVKETINNQIADLRNEQTEKEKQLEELQAQKLTAGNELALLKKESELLTRIADENISAPAQPLVLDANLTVTALKEKYTDKIAVSDPTDPASFERSNTELTNYNREIDALILAKNRESGKTKNAKTKQNFAREIKQLEAQKKNNEQVISKNEYFIDGLKKQNQLDQPVTINIAPISTSKGKDPVVQIDNLSRQLEFNDNQVFNGDVYTDPKAQQLKAEADASLKQSTEQQESLMKSVSSFKGEYQQSSKNDSLVLHQESDSLFARAEEKRKLSNTAKGNEKTKLLNEARQLETAANEKLIVASEIVKNDHALIYSTNSENIDKLIELKKSPPSDVSKARNLLEESKIAFKQGTAMREEAASLNSAGAKLGNISNAEEKENEALLKQKEALDLLLSSNPGFELKVAETSFNKKTLSRDTAASSAKLSSINGQISTLLDTKIASYQKLYEANEAELSVSMPKAESNASLIESTPSLKSAWLSINKKVTEAKDFKLKSEDAGEASQKLSHLVNATKKQNSSLVQLNKLLTDLSVAASLVPQTPSVNSLPETKPSETGNVITPVESPSVSAKALVTLNADSLIMSDTSTAGLLSYLNLQNTGMRSEQAFNSSQTAVNNLKRIETEQMNMKDNKKNLEVLANLMNETQDPSILKQKATSYEDESEQDAAKSLEKRREAASANETDKPRLLLEATDYENQSLNHRFLSTLVNQKAFDIEYKTNDIAIRELRAKLSEDNQTLNSEQDQLSIDIQNLTTQITKLKEEAAGLPNRSAQLGALSNVEEKEREIVQKQKQLIEGLQKKYPDYTVKPLPPDSVRAMIAAPEDNSAREAELAANKISELTNLTNALTLEYESSKSQIPETLSTEQVAVKQNADKLNESSKQLLLEASNESDLQLKTRKMNQSAKLGNAALAQLNLLLPMSGKQFSMNGSDVSALNEIGKGLNGNETAASSEGNEALVIEGLEVVKGNAYTAAKPIPFDIPPENGLSFRVQIGAFRTQLPNNTFKGLSPLNGETTKNGYFRYTAGNFKKIEAANAVKNDLRKLGYRDAFVVAYKDGKRISASEAISILAQEGKPVDLNAPQTAGITGNLNIPKAILNEASPEVTPQDLVKVAKEIEQINGLFYTIQIGVYSRQTSKQSLLNLQPIYTKQLPSGLYRYTAGIYSDTVKVLNDRNRIVELGISDAFVGAYLNGNSLPFSEAKRKQANEANIQMEPENPVIFPDAQALPGVTPLETLPSTPADPNVKPFTNSVTAYPEATENNGIKTTQDGLTFKVQIGAFSKQVPNDVAARFSQIRNWPVENKQINGLYVYTIGNFKSAKFAKELKNEIAGLGLTDAFITVYLDGKKLYGAEANTLLSQ